MLKLKPVPDTDSLDVLATINPFNLEKSAVKQVFYDANYQYAIWMPDHETFYKQLTSRNFPLLSKDEQDSIRQAKIAIAGQGTVGANLAVAMIRYGYENLRICDLDRFDQTNLNRQPCDLYTLGNNKAEATAYLLSRINPFADIEVYPQVTVDNIDSFVSDCDLVISAIDDVTMIVHLNEASRQQRIPVLLGTDVGSRVLLDVFDYRESHLLMNGCVSLEDLSSSYLELVLKIVDPARMPPEMLDALSMRMREEINYFSQTVVSANVCSSMLTSAATNLILEKPLKSQSYIDVQDTISSTELVDMRHNLQKTKLAELTKSFTN